MFVLVVLDGQNDYTICGDRNGKPWESREAAYAALAWKYVPGYVYVYELKDITQLTKEAKR
jgi:hypothetical protein